MNKPGQQKKAAALPHVASAALEIHKIDRDAEVRLGGWKALTWIVLFICIYLSIAELAGKETLMTVLINAVVEAPSRGVSWAWVPATAIMGMWALIEHWLRLRKVDQMSGRIEELERRIDPLRTSSGLTSSGETPPIGHKK